MFFASPSGERERKREERKGLPSDACIVEPGGAAHCRQRWWRGEHKDRIGIVEGLSLYSPGRRIGRQVAFPRGARSPPFNITTMMLSIYRYIYIYYYYYYYYYYIYMYIYLYIARLSITPLSIDHVQHVRILGWWKLNVLSFVIYHSNFNYS